MNKNDVRLEYKKIRSGMSRNEVIEKSIKVLDIFKKSDLYKNINSIMLYYPLGNEVDVSLLFTKAFLDGKTVLLPVTDNDIITPIRIYPDTKYIKGEYCKNLQIPPGKIKTGKLSPLTNGYTGKIDRFIEE